MTWSSAYKKTPVAAVTCTQTFPLKFIDRKRIVTIDFETYWDTEYTLRKMSTSEYVRDKRFKAQMMGIKVGNKPTRIIPTGRIQAELKKINWSEHVLLCHNTAFDGFILSHHYGVIPPYYLDTLSMARGLHSNDIGASLDEVAQYYGRGNKIPDVLERTKGVLVWDKQLYADASRYCIQDVDLTLEIFECMHPQMPADEMDLIHYTCQMFCDPVLKVDLPRVEKELARELDYRKELMASVIDIPSYADAKLLKGKEKLLPDEERDILTVKRVIGSNERFAELLRAEGIDPPVKISPAWIKKPINERLDEDKWGYAFAKDDADFINLPEQIDVWGSEYNLNKKKDMDAMLVKQARIKNLVECRLAVKSTTNVTRAQRFLTAGANGMSLPVGYAYFAAHTGRFGGNNKMNMQNLTRGGELRLSILAPDGHQLVVQDSGQIEARVNGWLWGQHDLLDAFRISDTWDKDTMGVATGDNRDAYCRFGDLIYGREITTDDKMERFVSKVCVLGLGFQMGGPKLQITLAKGALGGPPVFFELDRCKGIINIYRRKNHRIQNGWEICKGIIEDMAAGREGSHGPIRWEKERIWLPNGMCLKYPDLKVRVGEKGWDEWSYDAAGIRKKIYGGLLCENLVQALARIIVNWQMLQAAKRMRIVMITHDENVACVKTKNAPLALNIMQAWMRTAPDWCLDIPLNSEGGFASNYSK